MEDRRHTDRVPSRSLVLLQEDTTQVGERCWMVNISSGGLAVHAPRDMELEVDGNVIVELPLGRSVSRIRTTCRVVDLTGGEPSIAHLQFVDTSLLFKRTLESALIEWERRTGEYEAQMMEPGDGGAPTGDAG